MASLLPTYQDNPLIVYQSASPPVPQPDPSLSVEIVPTGGVVALTMYSLDQVGPWVLTRSIVGSALPAVTVYNGSPLSPALTPGFAVTRLDAGDGTTLPLLPTNQYTWTFTTQSGSVTTSAVSPACTITLVQDEITETLIKLLQAGIESLRVPAGFTNKPSVMHAMPLSGQPALPIITINLDLMQQEHVRIGDSVNTDISLNQYALSAIVTRRFSVTVITTTTQERSFYSDAIVSLFRSAAGPALNRLGNDISHKFQVANSQETGRDQSPGFYYAAIMIEVSGMFQTLVTTDFGQVEVIDPEPEALFPTTVVELSSL